MISGHLSSIRKLQLQVAKNEKRKKVKVSLLDLSFVSIKLLRLIENIKLLNSFGVLFNFIVVALL